ncbi:MAG: radical SAM family heme chaperone HemW [Flavobacteriaceae bacterium]|nr:radical SAM family heme chaperone HemW [Flavobacteriaceae bacterium]
MAGLYIHVPFCRQRCHYCDFYFTTNRQLTTDFVAALCREIAERKDELGGEKIETIYFGGGTPSVLGRLELDTIFETITRHFQLSPNTEITLEANPDDLSREYIFDLQKTPVSRLSIGVQSFVENDLKWMNRAHSAAQSLDCVRLASDAGISNLSIDLIYGLPDMDNIHWQSNLDILGGLPVQHFSAYCLTVEPKTPLSKLIKDGKSKAPDESAASAHFDQLMDWAAGKGFEQYEISNFAKDGHYSRHNSAYWKGISYLGLGPSAHSFVHGERKANRAKLAQYICGERLSETENLSPANRFNEYILTSLRTMWGVELETLREKFSESYFLQATQKLTTLEASGFILPNQGRISLSRKGKHFADWVATEFFVE